MKNLYILPINKSSRLHTWINDKGLRATLYEKPQLENPNTAKNIYITSDEEIKDVRPHKGKWHLEKENILNKFPDYLTDLSECKLVIMTTDQDLIKDGVQAIDDEFLEWFVKNPNCEEVKVVDVRSLGVYGSYYPYKIIIPKEEPKQDRTCTNNCSVVCGECQILEPKQETLEEAAEKYSENWEEPNFKAGVIYGVIEGAKWQQKQMYSEEEVLSFGKSCFYKGFEKSEKDDANCYTAFREEIGELFKQFKK